jgi:hypothetical protein
MCYFDGENSDLLKMSQDVGLSIYRSIDWLLLNVKLTVFSENKITKNIHIAGRYARFAWVEYSITTEKDSYLPWNRFITAKIYCSLKSYGKSSIMCMGWHFPYTKHSFVELHKDEFCLEFVPKKQRTAFFGGVVLPHI